MKKILVNDYDYRKLYSCFVGYVLGIIKYWILNFIVRFQSWNLGNVEYSFITITPRSTLTWSGSTC